MKSKHKNSIKKEIFNGISEFRKNYSDFKKNLLRLNLIRNQLSSIDSGHNGKSLLFFINHKFTFYFFQFYIVIYIKNQFNPLIILYIYQKLFKDISFSMFLFVLK